MEKVLDGSAVLSSLGKGMVQRDGATRCGGKVRRSKRCAKVKKIYVFVDSMSDDCSVWDSGIVNMNKKI